MLENVEKQFLLDRGIQSSSDTTDSSHTILKRIWPLSANKSFYSTFFQSVDSSLLDALRYGSANVDV